MGPAVFLGLATVDFIYAVESIPRENQKLVAHRQEILCGGPAANAAIACAFLGGPATLVSAVGAHPLASVIREELEQFHIPLMDLDPSSAEMPPVSSILVSQGSGNRTVISGHATRKQAPREAFDAAVLKNAALLMVDGHQMSCAIRAAAEAKAVGIPVVLDGGSWKDQTDKLLAHTRAVICSEDFRPPGTENVRNVIAYLLDHGVEAAAITRGAKPVLWATRQEEGEVTVPVIAAVDTLGAGDIFHGAFCHRAMKGASFVDSLKFAVEVAAYSCQSFGTRAWMECWSGAKTVK
jgi:sugar/nucleoside kinase (ribokinase family)